MATRASCRARRSRRRRSIYWRLLMTSTNVHLVNPVLRLSMNFSRLILLACWFGAALFFGAVVAPAAFGVLRSFGLANANEIAGSIVTRSLGVVNIAGF